jgi:hypothetical protein
MRNLLATGALWLSRLSGPQFPQHLFDCGPLLVDSLLHSKKLNPPIAVLTHDIDTAFGLLWAEKIASVEERFGARSCWNVVPRHCAIDYEVPNRLLDHLAGCGHEIGLHGIWHTNCEAFLPQDVLSREFELLSEIRSRYAINAYRGPSWYRTAPMFDVLNEFFDIDLTALDIDLACPGGRGGVGLARPFRIRSRLIELPCTLPFEAPLLIGPRTSSFVDFWRPKIDLLRRIGGMLVVNSHPDPNYLGNPKMIVEYESLLKLLSEQGWQFLLPRDINQYWDGTSALKASQ